MSATCKLEAQGNRRTKSDGFRVEAAQGQVTYCVGRNHQLFPGKTKGGGRSFPGRMGRDTSFLSKGEREEGKKHGYPGRKKEESEPG